MKKNPRQHDEAKKDAGRKCSVCGGDLSARDIRVRVCSVECRRHQMKMQVRRKREALRGGMPATPRTPAGMRLKDRIAFYTMPVTESGCWIWVGDYGSRYPQIKISGRMMKAHRASWEAHVGPIPAGMNVLHRCDITCCVNPDHLFLGTQRDNVHDMHAKGRARKRGRLGENNPHAKLTAEHVREIRSSPLSEAKIASQFGISRANINAIRNRKTWRHVA